MALFAIIAKVLCCSLPADLNFEKRARWAPIKPLETVLPLPFSALIGLDRAPNGSKEKIIKETEMRRSGDLITTAALVAALVIG